MVFVESLREVIESTRKVHTLTLRSSSADRPYTAVVRKRAASAMHEIQAGLLYLVAEPSLHESCRRLNRDSSSRLHLLSPPPPRRQASPLLIEFSPTATQRILREVRNSDTLVC
jgi:hypothetical protein